MALATGYAIGRPLWLLACFNQSMLECLGMSRGMFQERGYAHERFPASFAAGLSPCRLADGMRRPAVPAVAAGGFFPGRRRQRTNLGSLPAGPVCHKLCTLRGPLPAAVPGSFPARASVQPVGAGPAVRSAWHCEPLQDLLPHGTAVVFRCGPAGGCVAGSRRAGAGYRLC